MIDCNALGPHFLNYFQDNWMRRGCQHFKRILIRDKFSNTFPITTEISPMDWWAHDRVPLCEVSVSNQPSGGSTNWELAGMWAFFLGGEILFEESSELYVICGEYECGNRTHCAGVFYSVPQISHTRICTALFELISQVSVWVRVQIRVVLKRQINSLKLWFLVAN